MFSDEFLIRAGLSRMLFIRTKLTDNARKGEGVQLFLNKLMVSYDQYKNGKIKQDKDGRIKLNSSVLAVQNTDPVQAWLATYNSKVLTTAALRTHIPRLEKLFKGDKGIEKIYQADLEPHSTAAPSSPFEASPPKHDFSKPVTGTPGQDYDEAVNRAVAEGYGKPSPRYPGTTPSYSSSIDEVEDGETMSSKDMAEAIKEMLASNMSDQIKADALAKLKNDSPRAFKRARGASTGETGPPAGLSKKFKDSINWSSETTEGGDGTRLDFDDIDDEYGVGTGATSSSSSSTSTSSSSGAWDTRHRHPVEDREDKRDKDKEVKEKDKDQQTELGNPQNNNMGTAEPAAQAQSQAFQRQTATGGAGFTPRETEQDETKRDKGGAGGGSDEMAIDLKQGGDSTDPTIRPEAEPSIRPQFALDSLANKVVPTPEKQIQSDVLFDMFSVVQPGFGLGSDNKLNYENDAREKEVHFKDPLYKPRSEQDIGIAQHVHPLRWELQPNDTGGQILAHLAKLEQKMKGMKSLIRQATAVGADGAALPDTTNVIASSKGLARHHKNVLEPVIHNRVPWQPVKEAPGYALNQRGFRHEHSPWGNPFQRETDRFNSGPVLKKRRALEVILP